MQYCIFTALNMICEVLYSKYNICAWWLILYICIVIIVIIHVILNVNWFMVVFDRLWSGRAVTEHKYAFLVFFVCVCLHVSLYVSNHLNHCIKLFSPCRTLIGNNKLLFFYLFIMLRKDMGRGVLERMVVRFTSTYVIGRLSLNTAEKRH